MSKKGKQVLFSAIAVCLLLGIAATAYQVLNRKSIRDGDLKTAHTSEFDFYKEKSIVEIIDSGTIQRIAEYYQLEDAEDIEKLIYVPLNEEKGKAGAEEVGQKYAVKQLRSGEKMNELVFDSWYSATGGSRELNEKFETKYEFENMRSVPGAEKTLLAELSESYGLDSMSMDLDSYTVSVEVEEGYKKNMRAYLYEIDYAYELWKTSLLKDKRLGEGTLSRPVGVMVVIGRDMVRR